MKMKSIAKSTLLRASLAGALLTLLAGCFGAVVAGAGAGTMSAKDSRSFGTQLDDEAIENRAINAIRERTDIADQSHVEVVSYNRIVLLVGQTPTVSYKQTLAELVANVPNVRKVYNEMQVAGPRSALTAMSDSTITTKIKTSLLTESDFPSGKIKVVTENGEVFLMGLVSREQAVRATDIARGTGGVQKVVQLFEYGD
ncbi:BON domain-containing protein [Permianibacter sp. IMCC34836]|uniref:BON domain-containing protein n=1 Tax=Permianibacter fluminis TaxID=2738515 RepID=UPI00155253B5|nr:BON domain-containing protein [Permianibacter fluminis]NQD39050.1 BON domain-containing protein [Permianibacter fluminis]